jgi:PhzF family phenazine biosynthesis protein
MHFPVFHVDAFTERAFSGNPAAVCLLDFWLDDSFLRKVAAENSLPATAFLVASSEAYELRWFSPVCELKLCGHATLAAAFVLFHFMRPELDNLLFSTRFRGNLTVQKDDGGVLAMNFPALDAKTCAPTPELLAALAPNIDEADVVSTFDGNQTYVVLLRSQHQVQNFQPGLEALEKLHPHVLAITAPGDQSDFVSRYFAPGYGIPEDFVTGSSHCLLTPIWAQRLGKTRLDARQLSSRGGEVDCELKDDRVILRGKTVPVLKGMLTV